MLLVTVQIAGAIFGEHSTIVSTLLGHKGEKCTYHGVIYCALENLFVFRHLQCILGEPQFFFNLVAHELWCEGAIGHFTLAGIT